MNARFLFLILILFNFYSILTEAQSFIHNYKTRKGFLFYQNLNSIENISAKIQHVKNFNNYSLKIYKGGFDYNKIDSILYYDMFSSTPNKLKFNYSDEKVSEILWFNQNELFMRIRYFYKNTLPEKIAYEGINNDSVWLDSEINYLYNDEGLLKEELIKTDEGDKELTPWIKTTYYYSSNQKLQYYVNEDWVDGNWLLADKAFLEYSEDGNLISILFYNFLENNWQESSLSLYNYDEKYLKEILFSAYGDGKWKTIGKSYFSYQDFHDYKSKLINAELYENNQIIYKLRLDYHYDKSDYFLSCKVERQYYGIWISTNYPVSIYNPDGFEFHIFASDVKAYYNDNPTDVFDKNEISDNYLLSQNYPNPFNPATSIKYTLPEEQFVSVKIFNILGREVATLVSENKPAGNYEVNFDARNLSSGVYFYQLRAGNFLSTKKMILMK